MSVADRLAKVRQRIRDAEIQFGRTPGSVRLLAVSKTRSAEELLETADLGQRDFAENYLQEALQKQELITDPAICWHFIGPIQSNKTRAIANAFSWVHSVDRLKIARRLSDQRDAALPPLNICLQLNIDAEPTKSGATLEELPELAAAVAALPNLTLRGLMTIPAAAGDFESRRKPFSMLAAARASLEARGLQLDTLSMGMSADMEAAIAEGADMVRIGTAIFGPRPAARQGSPTDTASGLRL